MSLSLRSVRTVSAFVFLSLLLQLPDVALACSGQSEPDVEGTIIVEQADYFYKPAERKYSVVVTDRRGRSKRYEIEAPANSKLIPPNLVTGMKVKLHGKKKTDKKTKKTKYVLNENPTSSETGGAIEISTAPQVAQAGTGSRSMVTILVNFQTSAVPCSESQLDGILFSNGQSVRTAYLRSSYGTVNYVRDSNNDGAADIYRVTINASAASTSCDYSTWMSAANSALQSQYGVSVNNFTRKLYYFGAGVSSCGWAGLGTIGNGWSIVNGNYCATGGGDVAAHELGHNEQMHHSALDQDNNGASESEYGDTSDIMGYGGVGLRHFNAAHKVQMGWMPAANIASPASSQTLTLVGLEPTVSATQVIRAARAAAEGGFYYLSYRVDDGVLTGLPNGYKYKTNVHWSNGNGYSYFVKTLDDGMSFTDSVSGLTFTQNSHDTSSANVSLSFQCVRNSPSVTISPSNVNTNVPGATANYTVNITNRNSGCDPTAFNLASVVPDASWSASISSATMNLNSGASGSVSLSVQSPVTLADGRFTIGASAAEAGRASGSGNGSYTMDRTPPAAISNLSGSSSRGKNSLSWGAPSDGSGSGVASYRVYRNGTFLSASSVTSFADSTSTAGVTYNYTVTSLDVLGNQSLPSNVAAVTTSSTKGGGGGKGKNR